LVKAKKMRGMILATILFMAMAAFSIPQAGAADVLTEVPPEDTSDVSVDVPTNILTDISGNWAYAQISSLIEKGIAAGYPDGTFKPDNTVTRAEFMVMVNKAYGYIQTKDVSYSDVMPGDWFYNDIALAAAAGYIAGYDDGTMQPNSAITREQSAVILAKVLKLDTSTLKKLAFTDANSIGAWSLNSVSAMVDGGMISGYPDGTFKPAAPITRAEAAALIDKSLAGRIAVAEVSLQKNTLILKVGNSETIFVMIRPNEASDKEVAWSSDNPEVASVNSAGYITGNAVGECTVTVTSHDGGKTDTCLVTVVP
jgi:Bacterial Ig-like domain (group 2)/S-layer homology domain